MLLFKRIACGIVAFLLLLAGIKLCYSILPLWCGVGALLSIAGITLAHVAIRQELPRYNFWMTLLALCLAFALYITNTESSAEKEDKISSRLDAELKKSEEQPGKVKQVKKKSKKRSTGFNLASYPKISGRINVIHAHVFYINGRYIRLYGVDAPDNDQICSDATGASYNCGEEAASWIREWIDKNPVDCYLLKIVPNGQDLATCVWGEYDIGAALIASGWGLAKKSETDIYQPYEAKAQSESSGLWQGTFYSPEDWRDIKRHSNDFTVKQKTASKSGGFFGSLF
jgi:endonuclease YncB( thermonuclease family)